MARDHFAQLNRQASHRHDSEHDAAQFNDVMQTITGMLYSIVTLRAFFPFFRSPAKISDAVGYGLGGTANAPYPMPSNSVQCPCGCPPNACTCCCSKADGCSHR